MFLTLSLRIFTLGIMKKKYSISEIALRRQYWKTHPAEFMKEILGLELAYHQKRMLDAIVKYNNVTIRSANASGKSTLLSAVAIWFFYCYLEDDANNTIVVFTAPNFAQVRENIYNPIRAFIAKATDRLRELTGNPNIEFIGQLSENKNLAEIRYLRKNYIMGVSTEGENKNVGKHGTYVLCIFDEAQGISDSSFSDFEGITSSGMVVKKVMIGNTTLPNGNSGTFYNSFKPNSTWHQIKISCFDTPNFIKPNIKLEDYLKDENDPSYWRNKLDKYCNTNYYKDKLNDDLSKWEQEVKMALLPFSKWLVNPIQVHRILMEYGGSPESYEFKTRCLAEFPSGDESSVFPQEWINASMLNYNNPSLWQTGEIVAGVDVASGVGGDKSAIAIRNGNKIIYIDTFNLELFDLIEKIKEIYVKYNVSRINIELDGVGRDKFLILQNSGLPVFGIQTGGGAGQQDTEFIFNKEENERRKKDFYRKRDEVWWNLRNLLNPIRPKVPETEGKLPLLLPDNTILRQELSAITYSRMDNGKIKIISKDQLRDKIDRSPDLSDAICFACYGQDDFFYMPCAFGAINISTNNRFY